MGANLKLFFAWVTRRGRGFQLASICIVMLLEQARRAPMIDVAASGNAFFAHFDHRSGTKPERRDPIRIVILVLPFWTDVQRTAFRFFRNRIQVSSFASIWRALFISPHLRILAVRAAWPDEPKSIESASASILKNHHENCAE